MSTDLELTKEILSMNVQRDISLNEVYEYMKYFLGKAIPLNNKECVELANSTMFSYEEIRAVFPEVVEESGEIPIKAYKLLNVPSTPTHFNCRSIVEPLGQTKAQLECLQELREKIILLEQLLEDKYDLIEELKLGIREIFSMRGEDEYIEEICNKLLNGV